MEVMDNSTYPLHIEISLNSVVRPVTQNDIHGQDVLVMIDLGTRHNILSMNLIRKLEIPITPSKALVMSTGEKKEHD